MSLWSITAVSTVISCFYYVTVSGQETELVVADNHGMKIHRLNLAGEVTRTYNYISRVGSVAYDTYNIADQDHPNIIYGLSGNDSGQYDSGMYRQNFKESKNETLLRLQDGAVDQIVVDPFTGNIYYRGFYRLSYTSYISVIFPDGTDVPVIRGLESGCCLALYPGKGLMFWTEDKYLSTKYISSASMDGSNLKYIVTSNLQHPYALAIDYYDDMLYWADWVSGKIERCNLEGGSREIFLETGQEVVYMVIDRGIMYYTVVGESIIRKVKLTDPYKTEIVGSFSAAGYFIALDIYPRDNGSTIESAVPDGFDQGVIIASVAAVLFVVLAIVISLVFLREKRRNKLKTKPLNKVAVVMVQ